MCSLARLGIAALNAFNRTFTTGVKTKTGNAHEYHQLCAPFFKWRVSILKRKVESVIRSFIDYCTREKYPRSQPSFYCIIVYNLLVMLPRVHRHGQQRSHKTLRDVAREILGSLLQNNINRHRYNTWVIEIAGPHMRWLQMHMLSNTWPGTW